MRLFLRTDITLADWLVVPMEIAAAVIYSWLVGRHSGRRPNGPDGRGGIGVIALPRLAGPSRASDLWNQRAA